MIRWPAAFTAATPQHARSFARPQTPCCAGNGGGAQTCAGALHCSPPRASSTGGRRTCSSAARSARPRRRRGTMSASGWCGGFALRNEQAAGRPAALEAAAQAARDLGKARGSSLPTSATALRSPGCPQTARRRHAPLFASAAPPPRRAPARFCPHDPPGPGGDDDTSGTPTCH